ncbi:serine protease [Clavibacter michiganensis]|uniref:trypsin-like serine peptidase n=1 Tax=Clavibacter michiganensis TaxID=28447 RepID=UPI000CE774A9|nr:serine protease [Clavibacter michiganensis]PPF48343.1 serine protease [Clavibacter michiganensis]
MPPRPSPVPPRRAALVAVIALGAALLGCAPAAVAAEPAASAASATAAPPSRLVVTPEAAAAALAYWTPERLAAATDRGKRADGPAPALSTAARPAAATGSVATSAARTAAGRGQHVAAVPHIGRLFGVDDVGGFSCSANVVRSGNRSTIATAGHCVSEHRYFATQLVFLPGYDSGESALGSWPVVGGNVPTRWFAQDEQDDDAAFLAVGRDAAGRDIQSVTGASPVAFDAALVQRASGYGYPTGAPYDGETLIGCQGTTTADGPGKIGFLCDMTYGVSGGPLFIGGSPDGTQFSDLADGDDLHCNGPAWQAAERSAYDLTAAIAT